MIESEGGIFPFKVTNRIPLEVRGTVGKFRPPGRPAAAPSFQASPGGVKGQGGSLSNDAREAVPGRRLSGLCPESHRTKLLPMNKLQEVPKSVEITPEERGFLLFFCFWLFVVVCCCF